MRGLCKLALCLMPMAFCVVMTTDALAGPEAVRIPKAFSFEPDDSPLILSAAASPGSDGQGLAMRNPNLYRRFHGGGRRVAEIIEHEPVTPGPSLDTPAMVPPANGTTPRAEVKLPSSSRGVGVRSYGE